MATLKDLNPDNFPDDDKDYPPLPLEAAAEAEQDDKGPCVPFPKYIEINTNILGPLQAHGCLVCMKMFIFSPEYGFLVVKRDSDTWKRLEAAADEVDADKLIPDNPQ